MQKQKEVVRRIADEDDEDDDDDDDYPSLQKEKKEGSSSDLSKVIPSSKFISLNVCRHGSSCVSFIGNRTNC